MEEEFNEAVERMRTKRIVTEENEKYLYGLYKRVRCGECNEPPPWSYQVYKRGLWEAWYKNNKMTREEAMRRYIEKVNELI